MYVFFKKVFLVQHELLGMLWLCLFFLDKGSDERNGKGQANVTVADSVALCSIFNRTNRIEPVFLAPFRLYCKLVRRPGQGCSSAPWAPCRMQPSYRSFTVHHGVWFWLVGFHSTAAATGSLQGWFFHTYMAQWRQTRWTISRIAKTFTDVQRISMISCRCEVGE